MEYPGCTRLMGLIIHISHVEDHAENLFVSPFLTYDYEKPSACSREEKHVQILFYLSVF